MIRIKVTGIEQLNQNLAARRDFLGRQLAQALRLTAEQVARAAAARHLEQRDPNRPLPSALADSIFVEERDEQVVIGAHAPHAAFVEFGTSRHVPRPFLQPAVLEAGGFWRRILAVLRKA